MNRHARKHFLINALSCLTFALFATSCGQSGPSEKDAQAIVESRLITGHKIIAFQKTNGQEIDGFGVKGYRMFYEATIQYTCDTKAGCALDGKHINIGEIGTYKWTGRIVFEKSEHGWVNGRMESTN